MVNGATMARYPPRKVWDLRDLPSASAPGVTKITLSEPRMAVPVLPGERPARPWWPLPATVAGALLILAAAVVFYRRRYA